MRNEDIAIPIGRLVVVTGVSGSGKSTVARDVLYANLRRWSPAEAGRQTTRAHRRRGGARRRTHRPRARGGPDPIGKTPRSCPATYIGFWDDIRKIFANTTEAKIAGYTASRFSFNTAGGRCAACEGQGMQTIEMNFLPDVKVLCDVVPRPALQSGDHVDTVARQVDRRPAGHEHRRRGGVLRGAFLDSPRAAAAAGRGPRLSHAGPAPPTLSGGEAQRIKLVTELAKVRGDERRAPRQKAPHTLYVLDEPTVGLHMADVEKLIHVLHRLVDAGNTVVVVEHNLDVMAEADWIIDMGPEAGAGGGKVVAAGPPGRRHEGGGSRTPAWCSRNFCACGRLS